MYLLGGRAFAFGRCAAARIDPVPERVMSGFIRPKSMSFEQNKLPEKFSFFRSVKISLRFRGSGGTATGPEQADYAAMQHQKRRPDMHFVISSVVDFKNLQRRAEKTIFYSARRKTEFICNGLGPPVIFHREGDRLNDG